MNLRGVISPAREVIFHQRLQRTPLEVGAASAPRVEQNLAHEAAQTIAIPDSKMIELVPPEYQPLEMEGSQRALQPGDGMRHAQVPHLLGLEPELCRKPSKEAFR